MEVRSGMIGDHFYGIRGLDVSWISCYEHEREFLVHDATLPILQNKIVDYSNLAKQTSYLK